MLFRHMVITASALGLFALIGTAMVAVTHDSTEERIAQNERDYLLRTLNTLVPPSVYNNSIHDDVIMVQSKELLGSRHPVTIYRARYNEHPVAVIMTPVAPDGYNGAIKLMVAVRPNGTIMGVRVLSHRETPGLGDAIEADRSDWINGFVGFSIDNPDELGWHVEKDGGIFDQFTGATITPRAVVKAVHNSLKYFEGHKTELFETARVTSEEPIHGTN